MPLRCVYLFDLDGTLVRTGGAGVRAMSRGFESVMGWSRALESVSLAGMTDPAIAHLISRERRGCDMAPQEMALVFEAYLAFLKEELAAAASYRVLPGIREFLDAESRRPDVLIGLGTGNLEQGARIKLEHGGLSHYFRFGGYGSDACARHEVLIAGVRRAEAAVGESIPPEKFLVIGDTPKDILAGQAIGARTLAVATGPYTPAELDAHQPDAVVAQFDDPGLAGHLKRLFP